MKVQTAFLKISIQWTAISFLPPACMHHCDNIIVILCCDCNYKFILPEHAIPWSHQQQHFETDVACHSNLVPLSKMQPHQLGTTLKCVYIFI